MKKLFYFSLFSLFVIVISLFFTNFYDYCSSSIFTSSLLRVARGKSYATDLSGLPILINPYSHYFFWFFKPLLRLFSLTSLQSIVWLVRIIIFGMIGACYFILLQFYKTQFKDKFSKINFDFAFLGFLFIFANSVFSIRVDIQSILFSLLGMVLFFKYYFSKKHTTQNFVASIFMFSIAIVLKLNTVGLFSGVVLFLLLERKFLLASMYSLAVIATTASIIFLTTYFLDPSFLVNLKYGLLPSFSADLTETIYKLSVAGKIIFLQKIVFYFIAILGVMSLPSTIRKYFISVMVCAFLVATFGQLRRGGSFNYYYSFFLVACIPFAIGLEQLLNDKTKIAKVFTGLVAFVFIFQIFMAYKIPYDVFFDYRANYHFKELKEYVEKKFPKGPIYSDNNNVILHFQDRAVLLPWAEDQIEEMPFLREKLPEISEKLNQRPFVAAIAAGPYCELWKPDGVFIDHIEKFKYLDKKMGNLCVFVDASNHHPKTM